MQIQFRNFLRLSCVLVGGLLALNLSAAAQDAKKPEVVKSSAQKSRGGGEDANVKQDYKPNHAGGQEVPPPTAKSETRGEARGCAVHVNNYTALYVQIYVDGYFQGTVGPWGDGWVYPGTGGTTLYAKAPFDDGTFLWWRNVFACANGGVYEWRIDR